MSRRHRCPLRLALLQLPPPLLHGSTLAALAALAALSAALAALALLLAAALALLLALLLRLLLHGARGAPRRQQPLGRAGVEDGGADGERGTEEEELRRFEACVGSKAGMAGQSTCADWPRRAEAGGRPALDLALAGRME